MTHKGWRVVKPQHNQKAGQGLIEIDHELISTVLLPLLLIQEGSCQLQAKVCPQRTQLSA